MHSRISIKYRRQSNDITLRRRFALSQDQSSEVFNAVANLALSQSVSAHGLCEKPTKSVSSSHECRIRLPTRFRELICVLVVAGLARRNGVVLKLQVFY